MKSKIKKGDRIAIIGGGPAGTHMAYLLSKRGYKNITIFEKNNRLGGKSYSINHDNVVHEMGTCYLSASYKKVMDLMAELDYSEYISIEPKFREAWTPKGLIRSQTYILNQMLGLYKNSLNNNQQSLIKKLVKQLPIIGVLLNKLEMRDKLLKEIDQYIKYYDAVFSNSEYRIPTAASIDYAKAFDQSMQAFLLNKNCHLLQTIFFITNTLMCYGYPDTTSNYYGLYWMDKSMLEAYSKYLMKQPANINTAIIPLGFQKVWEKAAAASKAIIKYNSNINYIKRSDDLIKISSNNNEEEFDFLISAISAEEMLKILDEPTEKEKRLFNCFTHSIAVTTLVVLDSPYPKSGVLYWFDNLQKANQDKVFAIRASAPILQNRFSNINTAVAYQYYDDYKDFDSSKSDKHFIDSFEQANIKIKSIVTREIWPYFYRYKQEDIIKGLPWQTDNIQGENKTWYVGSSLSFDSVNAVVNFNHYIVDKFLT